MGEAGIGEGEGEEEVLEAGGEGSGSEDVVGFVLEGVDFPFAVEESKEVVAGGG